MGAKSMIMKERLRKRDRKLHRILDTPRPCAGPWGRDEPRCSHKVRPRDAWQAPAVPKRLFCSDCEKGIPDNVQRKRFYDDHTQGSD